MRPRERTNLSVKGAVFNTGHNRPGNVRALVEMILRLSGRTDLQPEILGKGSLPGEIDRQWLDGAKAKRVLGWEPRVGLEEGLRKTVAWEADDLMSASGGTPIRR